MTYNKYLVLIVIVLLAAPCIAEVTIHYDWPSVSYLTLGQRFFPGGYGGIDYYDCGVRTWAYNGGYPVQGDYYFAWITNLTAGDAIHFEGKGCPGVAGSRFSQFWTYDCSHIIHDYPCSLSPFVPGQEIDSRDLITPNGACGLVICGSATSNPGPVFDWFSLTIPNDAIVVLPNGVVANAKSAWGAIKRMYR